jgi:hypothetical protein
MDIRRFFTAPDTKKLKLSPSGEYPDSASTIVSKCASTANAIHVTDTAYDIVTVSVTASCPSTADPTDASHASTFYSIPVSTEGVPDDPPISNITSVSLSISMYTSPNQPHAADIPTQQLKNRNLRFQAVWFQRFPWLHYALEVKGVICFHCSMAASKNLLGLASRSEDTFISSGFKNWRKAVEKFQAHEKSSTHAHAIHQLKQITRKPVVAQLSDQKSREQASARIALLNVISSMKYLARQGLAFRGHEVDEGNYKQLLLLRSEDVPELKTLLLRTTNFTSPDCQNEILTMMSHDVLRQIVREIKNSKQFSVIMDGTQDVSGIEQESICVRYVDRDLQVHEAFLGFVQPPDATGETLATIIVDTLLRLALPIEDLRAQTYDGAANMSGCYRGCQARVLQKQPLALYFHCGGHCVNLVAESTVTATPLLRDSLQWCHELGVLYGRSSKFKKIFTDIAESLHSSFTNLKPLCPTRWLVRKKAIVAILSQYEAVVTSLEEMAQSSNCETSIKANNLLDRFQKGSTVLGLIIAKNIFQQLESLNSVVQAEMQTISGMLQAVSIVQEELRKLRSEDEFKNIFEQANEMARQLDLEPIMLPRKRRPARQYIDEAPAHFGETAEQHYRQMYFMAIDHAAVELTSRFDTNGISTYKKLENMILEGTISSEIVQLYPEFEEDRLKIQLAMFKSHCSPKSLHDAKIQMRTMVPEVRMLFTQVEQLLRLLLVCPVSSCEAERSFSSLRRLKSWLRSTMSQQRLNSVAVCHTHQDYLDKMDLVNLAREFIDKSQTRKGLFGHFL